MDRFRPLQRLSDVVLTPLALPRVHWHCAAGAVLARPFAEAEVSRSADGEQLPRIVDRQRPRPIVFNAKLQTD